MFIPFFFTSYRKAPLATCLSFLSSMNYLFAVFFVVGYILNWSGARADMTLGESLIAGAVFGVIGFAMGKLAEKMAARKQRKIVARTTRI